MWQWLISWIKTFIYVIEDLMAKKPTGTPQEIFKDWRPQFDLNDPAGWDQWWEKPLTEWGDDFPLALTHLIEPAKTMVPRIRQDQLSTVLDVGCGIHLQVKALAALGLQVTGLDLSPKALAYATEFAHLAQFAGHFFEPEDMRPGGSWNYVQGDLLDASVCPGPYDIVFCLNVLGYQFWDDNIDAAVEAITQRLSPNGILVITLHNARFAESDVRKAIEARDFYILPFRDDAKPQGWFSPDQRRVAYFMSSSG